MHFFPKKCSVLRSGILVLTPPPCACASAGAGTAAGSDFTQLLLQGSNVGWVGVGWGIDPLPTNEEMPPTQILKFRLHPAKFGTLDISENFT